MGKKEKGPRGGFVLPLTCASDAPWQPESVWEEIAAVCSVSKQGPKFHLIVFAMGSEIMWSYLMYIPHRWVVVPPVQFNRSRRDETTDHDEQVGKKRRNEKKVMGVRSGATEVCVYLRTRQANMTIVRRWRTIEKCFFLFPKKQ